MKLKLRRKQLKKKKLEKTPVRSKAIRSMIGTAPSLPKLSQLPELIKIE